MPNEECCEHLGCKFCKYAVSGCKREKGGWKLSKPWFSCDRFNSFKICNDYEPAPYMKLVVKEWKGFEDYFIKYCKYWLPYFNSKTFDWKYLNTGYILNDDTSVRYYVNTLDFIHNNIWDSDGNLDWKYKSYYKRCKSPTGYEIVTEYRKDI